VEEISSFLYFLVVYPCKVLIQQCCGHQLMHIRAHASEHWLGSGVSWREEPGKKLRKTGATFSKLEPVSRQKKNIFSLVKEKQTAIVCGMGIKSGRWRGGEGCEVLWKNVLFTKFATTWGEIWSQYEDELHSALRLPNMIKVYHSWLQNIFSFWPFRLSFHRSTNQPITNISKKKNKTRST